MSSILKRSLIALFLLCGTGSLLQAQEAKTCFVNMPDSLCPLLTAVNRADFIDFLESHMKAEVTNTFGGKSEMTELAPDYLRVKLTEQTTWQMKLLPLNDSTQIICTAYTACAPACDSHIRFYTTQWEELKATDYLPTLPRMEAFIEAAPDTADIYDYQEARRQADLLLMKADLCANDRTLTFILTTPDYMEREAADKLKPFLALPVIYFWNEGRFTLPEAVLEKE